MSCDAKIIVLLSKAQFAKGNYVVSIDVVQAKKAEALIKTRAEKDGYVMEDCLMDTGKSPTLCLQLKDGRCAIEFEVFGALKPATDFSKGENVLQFTKKGKEECRKVVLERNNDDLSKIASITFSVPGKFLHRDTIFDVPLPAEGDTTVMKVEEKLASSLTVSDSNSEDVVEHVLSDSGEASVNVGNEAFGVAPRPPVISLMRQQDTDGHVRPQQEVAQEPSDPLQTATIHRPTRGDGRGDDNGVGSDGSDEYGGTNDDDTDSALSSVSRRESPSSSIHPSIIASSSMNVTGVSRLDPPSSSTRPSSMDSSYLDVSGVSMGGSSSTMYPSSSTSSFPDATSTCASRGEPPNPRGDPPYPRGEPPNQRVEPPNPRIEPPLPNPRVEPPNQRGEPPNQRGESPNQRGEPPNQKGEPPNPIHTCSSSSSLSDDTPRGKILKNPSLNTLAKVMPPQVANRLFAGLNIPDATIKQAWADHPRDVVEAHYQILQKWRNANVEQGVDALYIKLLQELSEAGRTDIKRAIEAAVEEGNYLTSRHLES